MAYDDCALHCVAHGIGACSACKCIPGFCKNTCHPRRCYECDKFMRWGVNVQQFFVDWKNTIERAYEDIEDNTYNRPTRVDSSQFLLASCQICKQYSYVAKYFRAHVGRTKWEANACALVSKQLLSRELNLGVNRFLLRTDHWTKRKPS
jgi:hypothetical protein